MDRRRPGRASARSSSGCRRCPRRPPCAPCPRTRTCPAGHDGRPGGCAGSWRAARAACTRTVPRPPCRQQVADRDDERRVGDDAPLAVHELRQLGQGPMAVAGSGLGDRLVELLPAAFFSCVISSADSWSASACAYQTSSSCISANSLIASWYGGPWPVVPPAGACGRTRCLPRGDLQARGQPLDVPFPRARDGSRRSRSCRKAGGARARRTGRNSPGARRRTVGRQTRVGRPRPGPRP